MKTRTLFASILVLLSFSAVAGGYSGSFRIVEYHLDQYGNGDWNLWIKADPVVTFSTGCTNTLFYVLPMVNTTSDPYSRERYAAILAAFAAGKSIEVYLAGCYGTAPNDYPLIDKSRFKIAE